MSRLIVKNLPNSMTDARLRDLCTEFGAVTDCSIRRDAAGRSRRFGFLGFSSEDSAQQALGALNGSYVGSSRVTVEVCKPLGQSTGSGRHKASQNAERRPKGDSSSAKAKTPAKKGKPTGALGEVQTDSGFSEFLEAHVNRAESTFWGNDYCALGHHPAAKKGDDDDGGGGKPKSRPKPSAAGKPAGGTRVGRETTGAKDDYLNFDDDGDDGDDGDDDGKARKEEVKPANMKQLSDLEYLRTKMVKALDSDDGDDDGEEEEGGDGGEGGGGGGRKSDSDYETGGEGGSRADKGKQRRRRRGKITEEVSEPKVVFTAKLRGVPFNVKEDRIREFFLPLRPESVRIVTTKHGSRTGYVFVDFKSEDDLRKALKRNKDYMGERYIEVARDTKPGGKPPPAGAPTPRGHPGPPEDGFPTPDVAETGRLFVRNLPYTCSQHDVEQLFSKHGPLSDVRFPLDTMSGRPKGFALVGFEQSEDAVRALALLDGSIFQGRMLHVLPAAAVRNEEEGDEVGPTSSTSSYKRDKEKRDKASSHNWNALFLGINAVADAMATAYGTSKRRVLDHETEGSAAVRLALGEAEIVTETRHFLEEAGVQLNAFGQPTSSRSDRVFLIKNLPASAEFTQDDLSAIVGGGGNEGDGGGDGAGCGDARHRALGALLGRAAGPGGLSRLLLPPRGLTALAEFSGPDAAKRAFARLAYSKFKSVPLFLEWAPIDVFAKRSEEVGGQPDAGVRGHVEVTGQAPRRPPRGSQQQKRKEEKEEKEEEGRATAVEPEGARGKGTKPVSDDEDDDEDDDGDRHLPGCTVFIKNLNLLTTEDTLEQVFSKCGRLRSCSLSRKTNTSGEKLSMGYGFVEFREPASAKKALKTLQHAMVDNHKVELKISERATRSATVSPRAPKDPVAPTAPTHCSKLLVRNVPFQAKAQEIRELFSTFGELRSVRLPRKPGAGAGTNHRGFAFVDFISTRAARRAMASLCSSTHLYGRRLVLEFASEGTDHDLDTARRKSTLLGSSAPKKRHSELLDDIMRMVEGGEGAEGEEDT